MKLSKHDIKESLAATLRISRYSAEPWREYKMTLSEEKIIVNVNLFEGQFSLVIINNRMTVVTTRKLVSLLH